MALRWLKLLKDSSESTINITYNDVNDEYYEYDISDKRKALTTMIEQTVTILIGPPGCGKSSYVKKHKHKFDFIMNSDNIVMKLCRENNMQYHEFFELPTAHKLRKSHQQKFNYAIKLSKQYNNIVWDLTNLTIKARQRIRNHYPSASFEYVEFYWQDDVDALFEINKQRYQQIGKFIEERALTEMIDNYQPFNVAELS
ncbi:AAA family ATPase [Thalassotalea psychrophila]|uniref:AAA family ATPase n=1 Tax=Thalassotalea psychrophila TaxID=3065647 RepID=A0ABY9TPZ7_9GAMM|nr:AAA family ATPase [Colwelliaceae bacterium SQ149]